MIEQAMRRHILLVEDEDGLVLTLTDRLVSEGYLVDVKTDGDSALEAALAGRYDVIVLDVTLPKKNGFDVCRDLRQQGVETPVLMLTARTQVIDRVLGLKLGADDYMTKPFDVMELLARIEALLRRGGAALKSSTDSFAFGDVRVDFRRAEVQKRAQKLDVSALELKLLKYFVEHRGLLLTHDELLEKVWGYEAMPVTRTVDVHVASLRQKLEPNPSRPQFILTVHGLGYKFVA